MFSDFRKTIEASEPAYFLGTIALTGPDKNSPHVTDGQQRLSTTSILLSAIQDCFHKKGNDSKANWIENDWLMVYDPDEDRKLSRMTLNVDDRAYFSDHIATRPGDSKRQGKPKGRSNELLQQAIKSANEHVGDLVKGYSDTDAAKKLVKWITDYALVIVLYLPNDLNAFQMLETLNDRGLKTSQVDIIKIFLFSKAGDRMSQVQPVWSKAMGLLDSLESDDIALQFLRHFVTTVRL